MGKVRSWKRRWVILSKSVLYYFEGEKDAERRVRIEFPNGTVHHFEGVKGAERDCPWLYRYIRRGFKYWMKCARRKKEAADMLERGEQPEELRGSAHPRARGLSAARGGGLRHRVPPRAQRVAPALSW